ncbi:MAG: gliding motility-associated C-terminal domain-containing protein [Bacteroidetes bacterium]|nr:gliding motility-associated C-terminal domain-containing protein [Bacteroidota bacterium]
MSVTPTATTTYTLSAKDANGCNVSATHTITGHTAATVSVTALNGKNIVCTSGLTSATSTTLEASGASSYVWSTGATGASISVNAAATYTVTGTDANGCESEATIPILEEAAPTLTITSSTGFFTTCGTTGITLTGAVSNVPATVTTGYSYQWTGGPAAASYPNVLGSSNPGGTTYTVTATSPTVSGCSVSTSQAVTNSTPATLEITGDEEFCIGSTSPIQLVASTGFTNYTWGGGTISGTGSTVSVTPTATTTYTLSAKDANGCEVSTTHTITGVNAQSVGILSENNKTILCNTGPTSATSVNLTATPPGLSYQWSTGENTETINVSSEGTYTVELTDGNGCVASNEIIIYSEDAPDVDIESSTDQYFYCQNSTTESLNAVVTNNTGISYNYTWTRPNGFNDNGPLLQSISEGGAYTVQVVSQTSSGCVTTVTQNLGSAIPPQADLLGDAGYCEGTSHELTTDYNSDYSYTWVVPAGITASSTTSSIQLANSPGDYYVLVNDQVTGCTNTSNVITVVEYPTPNPSITTVGNKTIVCNSGGNTNSLAESTTLETVQGYNSYTWHSTNTGLSQTLSGANAGHLFTISSGDFVAASEMFSVSVTDVNGCVGTSSQLQITKEDAPELTLVSNSENHCYPDPTIITVSASSPVTYNYTWYSDADLLNLLANGNQLSVVLNPGQTEDYTVQAVSQSGSGCTTTSSKSITSYSKPEINFTGTELICLGGDPGLIQSVVTPVDPVDPAVPYTYVWTRPNGAIVTPSNPDLSISTGGQYSLKVTDETTGCSKTEYITIQEFAEASISIIGPDNACINSQVSFTAVPSNNLTTEYEYHFYHDGSEVWSTSNEYLFTAAPSSDGIYTVVGTHDNGCIAESIAHNFSTSNVPALPTLTSEGDNYTGLAYSTDNICIENGSVTNNLKIKSNIASPTNYTFQWYSVGGGLIPSAQSKDFHPTSSGDYYVRVTNSVGCYAESLPITISSSVVHTVNIVGDDNICTNIDPNTNALQAIVNPIAGAYSYQWYINGTSDQNQAFQEYEFNAAYVNMPPTNNGENFYSVIATNAVTGCWASDQKLILYQDPPEVDITTTNPVICPGGEVMLTVVPGPPLTQKWYVNGIALESPYFTSQSITADAPGLYKVVATDPNSGCIDSTTYFLDEAPSVGLSMGPLNLAEQKICFPSGQVTLKAETVDPGYYTYTWKRSDLNGITTLSVGQNITTYNATTPGDYTVEIFNPNTNCTEISEPFTVELENIPDVIISGPTNVCGPSVILASTVESIISNPDYTYTWYRNDVLVASVVNSPTLTILQGGSYKVKAESKFSSCQKTSDPYDVGAGPGSQVNLVADASQFCNTGQVVILANPTVVGTYDFEWTSSLGFDPSPQPFVEYNQPNSSITVSTPDTYFVTVTNTLSGCISNQSILISPTGIDAEIAVLNDSILCDGEKGEIHVVPSSPGTYDITLYYASLANPPIGSFVDVTSAVFEDIDQAGTYLIELQGHNNNQCGTIKTVNVYTGITTEFTWDPFKDVLCQGETTTITAIPNIMGTYSYDWYNSSGIHIGNNSSLPVSIGGDYTLKMTNSQGCTFEDVISVINDNVLQVTIETVDPSAPPYLCAADGLELIGDVLPNPDNYDDLLFEWIKDTSFAVGFQQIYKVLDSGIYHLEVLNANGCRYSSTPMYLEDRRPIISYTSSHADNTICEGEDLELSFNAYPSSAFGFYTANLVSGIVEKKDLISSCNTCVVGYPIGYVNGSAPVNNVGGIYIMQATSANGCVSEEIINVTVNELPSFDVVSPIDVCQYEKADQLSIDVWNPNLNSASGDPSSSVSQGSFIQRWYSSPDTSSFLSHTPRPSTDTVGTTNFYVQVENASTGCLSLFNTVEVDVNPLPTSPTVISPLIACLGGAKLPAINEAIPNANSDYNLLKRVLLASGQTAYTSAINNYPFQSVWFESDTNTQIDLSASGNKIFPNLGQLDTTYYFVAQRDVSTGSNQCLSPKVEVPIFVVNTPQFNIIPDSAKYSVCKNDTISLSVSNQSNLATYYEWWDNIAPTSNGPTLPSSTIYQKSNPGPNFDSYLTDLYPTRTIWTRAVDSNQCFSIKSLQLDVLVLPTIPSNVLPVNVNYCYGEPASQLEISLSSISGNQGNSVYWFNSNNIFLGDSVVPNTSLTPFDNNNSFHELPYKYKLKNNVTGCWSDAFGTLPVRVHRLPDAPIIIKDVIGCEGMEDRAPSLKDALKDGGDGLSLKYYNSDTVLLSSGSVEISTLNTDTSVYYVSQVSNIQPYCESPLSEITTTNWPKPTAIVSHSDPDFILCYNESFTASIVTDSSKQGYVYTWFERGNPDMQIGGSNFKLSHTEIPNAFKEYMILTTDVHGCEGETYFAYDVRPVMNAPDFLEFGNQYCFNQDSALLIPTIVPGTNPQNYQFSWLDSNHHRYSEAPWAPTWLTPINNVARSRYYIQYFDTITGCYSDERPLTALIHALPPEPYLIRDWTACFGEPNPSSINDPDKPLNFNVVDPLVYTYKYIGIDSVTVLDASPIPSTLRTDTVYYFVRSIRDHGYGAKCESEGMLAIPAYTIPLPDPTVSVSDEDFIVCRGEAIEFEVLDTSSNGWYYAWEKYDARVYPPAIPVFPFIPVPGQGILYQDSVTYNTQYELITTDTNNCSSRKIWNITKADYPIVDSIIVKDITCFNAEDGEIEIFTRFGQSMKYSIDSGATYTYRAKDTALTYGWYYVDVHDNFSNCPTIYEANERRVFIHEPLPLKIDSVITKDITCYKLLDGEMQIVASGGHIVDSTMYNYQKPEKLYSIDAGVSYFLNDSIPGTNGSAMINLTAGLYQIRVKNENGCEAINNQNYTIHLYQPDSAYIDSIIVTPISCYNQTDGIIDIRAFGGNKLTYSIDSIQYFPSGLFTGLGSQAYFIEVVDSLGCIVSQNLNANPLNSQSDSVWVSEPGPLTVNPIVNQLLCFHDSTGLIELDIFGGNPNFQSYQFGYDIDWSVDTASLTMPINSSYYLPKNDSIYGLIAGNYYAYVNDYKGCAIIVPIQVNEPDPVIVQSVTVTPLSCYESNDGKVFVNATGGNYLEFGDTNLLGPISWQHNSLFTGLKSDTTHYLVRDSNACEVTYNAITKNFVPQPDSAYIDTIIPFNIKCFSDSTGSIAINAFGGNILSYSIDSVFTGQSFYTDLVADTFYIQVIDSKNCPINFMNNDSIIILTEPPLLELESSLAQGVTCYYDTTGHIGHTIAGGVLPYSLILNSLDTLSNLTLTTQLSGGPWYFTTYDANGCKDSSLIFVPTTDYDCDSIPNNVEGDTDFDFDGTPNMMDFDSDGDGIADIIERDYNRDGVVYDDCDNDGWPDYLDIDQCSFYIPNIVTPNGDGANDYFVIPDLDKYPDNRLSIYDRLGNMVFQETSYVNTFNGIANRSSALSTSNGQLPIGTYFYIVEVNGIPFQSGYIYIMR